MKYNRFFYISLLFFALFAFPSIADPTSVELLINGTATNYSAPYPALVNITAAVNVSDLPINITINGTTIANGTTVASIMGIWGVGNYYNITAFTPGNAAHDASSATYWMNVTNGTVSISILLNGTYANRTYSYPNVINASVASNETTSEGNITLYRNGTLVASSMGSIASEIILLGNGTYNYTAIFTASNYSSASIESGIIASVNKGTLDLSFIASNVTYPSMTNITTADNIGDSDVNYTLWRNDTLVNSSLGSSISNSAKIRAGYYVYLLNATEGANWTSNATGVGINLTVERGVPAAPRVTFSPSSTVTYPTATTATGTWTPTGDASDVLCTLSRSGTSTSSNCTSGSSSITETLTSWPGMYTYVVTLSAGENWTTSTNSSILTVNEPETTVATVTLPSQQQTSTTQPQNTTSANATTNSTAEAEPSETAPISETVGTSPLEYAPYAVCISAIAITLFFFRNDLTQFARGIKKYARK